MPIFWLAKQGALRPENGISIFFMHEEIGFLLGPNFVCLPFFTTPRFPPTTGPPRPRTADVIVPPPTWCQAKASRPPSALPGTETSRETSRLSDRPERRPPAAARERTATGRDVAVPAARRLRRRVTPIVPRASPMMGSSR